MTREQVLDVLREFREQYQDTNSYDDWLNKDGYKYAIDHEGYLYPPKHILSQVTGISTKLFSGGEQTNRVFTQLGFTVINK